MVKRAEAWDQDDLIPTQRLILLLTGCYFNSLSCSARPTCLRRNVHAAQKTPEPRLGERGSP